MAYNRKNILKKIIKVQNLTLEHTNRGVSQEWIYINLIAESFNISRSTFYSYLASNAKAELRKLKEIEIKHISMF